MVTHTHTHTHTHSTTTLCACAPRVNEILMYMVATCIIIEILWFYLDCIVPYICIQIDVKAGQANDVHVTNNNKLYQHLAGVGSQGVCMYLIIIVNGVFYLVYHIFQSIKNTDVNAGYYSISIFYLVQIKYFIMC